MNQRPTPDTAVAPARRARPTTEKMSRITRATALLMIAPMALLAACGDDDNGDTATETTTEAEVAGETPLSEEDWASEVNQLCGAHNAAIGQVVGSLFAEGPPADADAQAAVDQIVERTRTVTDEIDRLAEPSALSPQLADLVAALDAGSDEVEALGGPAFFANEVDPFGPAAEIAGELGLDACANEG